MWYFTEQKIDADDPLNIPEHSCNDFNSLYLKFFGVDESE
jgi:hypothetical protein